MKKILKITVFIFLLFGSVLIGLFLIYNEKLPTGKKGADADALAIQMFNALQHENFEKTEILEWSFRGKHHYKWHKNQGFVLVSWDAIQVKLYPNNLSKSKVLKGNQTQHEGLINKALEYFNNDSFWLIAPYKIFDNGTERSVVNYEGKHALLVTYTSGGTTPGDSYLWILDSNYIPTSFKMWTKIIPLGGVSATWDDFTKTSAGVLLPKNHKLSLFGMQLSMGDVKAYNPNADAFAKNILNALQHSNYKKTDTIEWSFRGKRFFLWDKKNSQVDVSWDTIKVALNLKTINASKVFVNGNLQTNASQEIIKRAWDIFNNDSFWLVAPHKLFDEGTIRNIVNIDNQKGLQVTYTTGGTTPGDSYIWFVDENYIPTKYLMTVPSMKMSNVPSTWEGWITTKSGTLLPTNHTFANGAQLSMGDVKAY